ncbi:carboxymuconolactone decarboxylase family protein [Acinetobacter sp. WCHAc010034]|uniref:carboxymuconolactone decarboxylase family protein n=1 Tax=Acinetobacter sp. WCHAc010034 TaxID=1879049 RepID=UPI00083B2B0C|nr:carboxymuconolactone decarboxylase family protein [Acinetobacter sp. WCHAc010034]AYA04347.1 carboxymuconolactone decarboxylase family protein [Acinetobacter sp. WCHAc010034]
MSYQDLTQSISKNLKTLHQESPELMQGFGLLSQAALKDGVLDKKTKEFIALAIGVANRCDACIGFHTQALVKLDASFDELKEVLSVAMMMGGGPSLMYASNAMDAFSEFSQK